MTTSPRQDRIDFYVGDVATRYDEGRAQTETWTNEDAIVRRKLSELGIGRGRVVIDAPIGTGRFLPLYRELGCDVVGLDVSPDMLAIASARASELGMSDVRLTHTDLMRTDLVEGSADVALCMRFAHLVPTGMVGAAIEELGRVAGGTVLITVPLFDPPLAGGVTKSGLRALARLREELLQLAGKRRTRSHRRSTVLSEIRRRGYAVASAERLNGGLLKSYWMFDLRKEANP